MSSAQKRGPVQEKAEVLAVSPVGAYTALTLVAPGIASEARPGQLISIAVGGPDSALVLRRTCALYGMTPAGDYAGTVQVVVGGPAAADRWLAARSPGDILDAVGPLGHGFELPPEPTPTVLVGGGRGSAALIPLARALVAQGSPVEFIVGAATGARLFGELIARRTAGEVTVTTEDGSAGERGRVTDVLPLVLSRSRATAVYASGPNAMLEAVALAADAAGVAAQVAIEASAACGGGLCTTCVLPVRGADGRTRFVRTCIDGPVLAASSVRWADIGRLPADLVGADAMGA
ncbi:MAG: dihydroorotate oxidase electron transfer subunit [Jatrophihabitantaceae bacterium]|nr:dihydroorotate oxidase electron transfer subunit [Jatrophihabitantaceae bacterium]